MIPEPPASEGNAMEEAASFPFINQGRKIWSDARAAFFVTVLKDIIKPISDIYVKWTVEFPLFPEPELHWVNVFRQGHKEEFSKSA